MVYIRLVTSMGGWCDNDVVVVRQPLSLYHPIQRHTFTQCLVNVGPTSQTMGQHSPTNVETSRY